MSLDDFARINDNTNDGEPMPRELLTHIYGNIAREELRISGAAAHALHAADTLWARCAGGTVGGQGGMASFLRQGTLSSWLHTHTHIFRPRHPPRSRVRRRRAALCVLDQGHARLAPAARQDGHRGAE